MADLVTAEELAVWTQSDVEPDDERAIMVLRKASELVADYAECPEWLTGDLDDVPRRARTIALLIAARTWTNPEGEVASGMGPLSSRVLEEMAAGMRPTEAEKAELAALGNEFDGTTGGLWKLNIASQQRADRVVYLFDASGSDWALPYGDFDSTDAFSTDDDTYI